MKSTNSGDKMTINISTASRLRTLICSQRIVVCLERGDVRLQMGAVSVELLDKRGKLYLETLASADSPDHVLQLASLIQW